MTLAYLLYRPSRVCTPLSEMVAAGRSQGEGVAKFNFAFSFFALPSHLGGGNAIQAAIVPFLGLGFQT
jgi:hypothetical protein